jgi:hypothetical protein
VNEKIERVNSARDAVPKLWKEPTLNLSQHASGLEFYGYYSSSLTTSIMSMMVPVTAVMISLSVVGVVLEAFHDHLSLSSLCDLFAPSTITPG